MRVEVATVVGATAVGVEVGSKVAVGNAVAVWVGKGVADGCAVGVVLGCGVSDAAVVALGVLVSVRLSVAAGMVDVASTTTVAVSDTTCAACASIVAVTRSAATTGVPDIESVTGSIAAAASTVVEPSGVDPENTTAIFTVAAGGNVGVVEVGLWLVNRPMRNNNPPNTNAHTATSPARMTRIEGIRGAAATTGAVDFCVCVVAVAAPAGGD